ncbi:MAG: rhomboid family intramembrane serine protease [Bdellovibrionaceae bacterium]|nr:rhomboid family intramembrane serine protease [Pseudobdellovibrionaceae bacterium]
METYSEPRFEPSTVESDRVLAWTWLMGKPRRRGFVIACLSTMILLLGTLWIWSLPAGMAETFSANRVAIFHDREWWRLWTALFAHSDLGHILSNAGLFFVFGLLLSGYFGLFLFPTMALAFGGLTNLLVVGTSSPEMHLIGMSGVVYWMGGVWLTLYFLLSRHLSLTQRTLRSFGVALMIFMPGEAFNPSISYKAHAVGFCLGVIFAFFYFMVHRSSFRAAERYTVLPREEDL